MSAKTESRLARTRLGRIALHALCIARAPSHWLFHWQGIAREFKA